VTVQGEMEKATVMRTCEPLRSARSQEPRQGAVAGGGGKGGWRRLLDHLDLGAWEREDAEFSAVRDEAFEQGANVLEDIALRQG
jgi:hypothetical protein